MKIEGNGRVTLMDQETGRVYERNIKHLKKCVNRSEEHESKKDESPPKVGDGEPNDKDATPMVKNIDGEG